MNKVSSVTITNASLQGENSEHFGLAAALCHGIEPIIARLRKDRKFKTTSLSLDVQPLGVQRKLVEIKIVFEFSELTSTEMYFANWSFIDKVKEKIISQMEYFSYEIPSIEDILEERVYDSIYFTIPIGDY